MILQVVLALVILYFGLNIVLVGIQNYKKHQFFQRNAPGLPVVKNSTLFAGHASSVALLKKNWKIMDDLHKKYGKSYGFYYGSEPWVATKDIDLLKFIEVDEGHKHSDKSPFQFPIKILNDSILQSNGDTWRRSRRVVAPALTNSKVCSEEISGALSLVVKELHVSLEKKMSESYVRTGKKSIIFHVDEAAQRFALAVIFSIGYKQDNIIDFDAKHDKWLKWINEGLADSNNIVINLGVMFPFIRPLARFATRFRSLGKVRAKVVDFLLEIIEVNRKARKQTSKKGESAKQLTQVDFKRRLVDTVVDAYLDEKITHTDLLSNMWAMLMAGFITTADALTCLVWHLALQPDIQEKLRRSISEEGVEGDYLMWCILETIRWHPPVPLGSGRILVEDVTLNGQIYPAGSYVFPTTRSIHRDESIWPDADKFIPERWSERNKFHPAAFMGFGLGPRNCPGGKLAIRELKLVSQMLLMNYRFEKCGETSKEFNFSSPAFFYNLVDQPIKVRMVALNN